jgi:hypothetical protein
MYRFFEADSSLLTHGSDNRNHKLLSVFESAFDLFAEIVVSQLDILFSGTIGQEHVKEAVIDVHLGRYLDVSM